MSGPNPSGPNWQEPGWNPPGGQPPGWPTPGAPGYGAPGYGAPGAFGKNSQATTALILSIVGILCCGPLSVVGLIMGRNEVREIDAGRMNPTNRGTANAAYIVGIIGVALWVLGVLFYVLVLGAVASSGA